MRLVTLAVVLGCISLATGCTWGGGPEGAPDDAPSPPTATPTATTGRTGAILTATTPDGTSAPPQGAPGAAVTRVVIVQAPELVDPGAAAEACWRVEGHGALARTALRAGPVGGEHAAELVPLAAAPVMLPATFCVRADVPTPLRLEADAQAEGGPSVSSAPQIIDVTRDDDERVSNDLPEIMPGERAFEACWMGVGAVVSRHTALHTDDETRADAGSFLSYTGAAYYPDNAGATMAGSFAMPGPFCADVTMPERGDLYLRPHAIYEEGLPGSMSTFEHAVSIGARVGYAAAPPARAPAGAAIEICWRAEGTGPIAYTALLFDGEAHPGATTPDVYASSVEPTATPLAAPGPFCASVTMPQGGALFVRPVATYGADDAPELGDELRVDVGG